MQNFAKTIVSAWTGGWFISAPNNSMQRQYQKCARLSYAYAWLADLSLIYLGGDLKRKERVSARLADGMSYLYMAMAALRNVQLNDDHVDEQLHAQWAVSYCYYHAQKSMIALCQNFPSKLLGFVARFVAFPLGQTMHYPTDKLDQKLARLMAGNNHYRDGLKKYLYLSGDPSQPVDRVEHALQLIIQTEELSKKVHDLRRFKSHALTEKLQEKVDKNELSQQEMTGWLNVEKARWDAILVDEFTFDSMKNQKFNSVIDSIQSPLN
jgi:hypothetical protein